MAFRFGDDACDGWRVGASRRGRGIREQLLRKGGGVPMETLVGELIGGRFDLKAVGESIVR